MTGIRVPSRPSTGRLLLAGGLIAAVALAFSACGSDDTKAAPAKAAAPATRTVHTAKGDVTVPAAPKRIVALAPQVRGTLYDLGVDPVGIYNEGKEYISPRYTDKIADATTIGTAGELDLEKIAALKPDLIIGVDYEWNTKQYGELKQIAPTVIADASTWQATAQTTADAVGKDDALTALEQKFDDRAAAIKKQYADVLGRYRWDILQGGFDDGKFWLYGPKSDAGAILSAAGVRFASASAAVPGPDDKPVSYEDLDTLTSADVIGFYANFDNTPTNNGPQLFKQAGFKALPAVKAGHTVPIPDFLPGGYGDALAVLDELEAGLKSLGGS